MNDALFELYNIAEKHGAPHQAFEAWAEKHFKPLIEIVESAVKARGELNRQIPHSQRTFNALVCLKSVDNYEKNPFATRKPKQRRHLEVCTSSPRE